MSEINIAVMNCAKSNYATQTGDTVAKPVPLQNDRLLKFNSYGKDCVGHLTGELLMETVHSQPGLHGAAWKQHDRDSSQYQNQRQYICCTDCLAQQHMPTQ